MTRIFREDVPVIFGILQPLYVAHSPKLREVDVPFLGVWNMDSIYKVKYMISGIFENVESTSDLDASLRYWHEFGYRPIAEGTLDANAAGRIYGHASAVRSARLQHGDSDDHGLIRVMAWDTLRDDGVGLVPPLTIGGRWFIQHTSNVLLLHDTFSDMRDAGMPVLVNPPDRTRVGEPPARPTLFDRRQSVREMMMLTPDHRHAVFHRFNYQRDYGTIDPASTFQTSEATHSTIIVRDGSQEAFYTDVLGLPLVGEGGGQGGDDPGDSSVLMVGSGQGWKTKRFLAPGLEIGMVVCQWPTHESPDLLDRSRPGSRGLCCFSYKVDDIAAYHARVAASSARQVSTPEANEFDDQSFSFIGPDDVSWILTS